MLCWADQGLQMDMCGELESFSKAELIEEFQRRLNLEHSPARWFDGLQQEVRDIC